MKEIPAPFIPPALLANQMREMVNLQRESVEEMSELNAEIRAMTAVLRGLVETHPNPSALMGPYLDRMEASADAQKPERALKYNRAFQLWRDTISAAAVIAERGAPPPSRPASI